MNQVAQTKKMKQAEKNKNNLFTNKKIICIILLYKNKGGYK